MENSLLSRPYTSPIVSFALGSDNSPRCNPESHHSLTLSQPLKPKDNSNESGNSLPKLNTKDLDHKYSIRFKKIPSYAENAIDEGSDITSQSIEYTHGTRSPKRENFLRITPSNPTQRGDFIKKSLRPPTTLSMKLRSEAAYVSEQPPTLIRDYFPTIDPEPYKKLLIMNPSTVVSLTPMSGMTSITSQESITTKKKIKEYYKYVHKQNETSTRLSGSRDTMAMELLNYQVYPDRNKMNYPSTICVKCSSSHASLCMECGEAQMDEALHLYRISRSEGSISFFNRAIISAGQKSNTVFIIFRIWKNYVQSLSKVRTHKYVMTGMRSRRKLLSYILLQWKIYVHETRATMYRNEIAGYKAKLSDVDNYLRKVRSTKYVDEAKLNHFQVMNQKKDNQLILNQTEILNLRRMVLEERQRVINLTSIFSSFHSFIAAIISGNDMKDNTNANKTEEWNFNSVYQSLLPTHSKIIVKWIVDGAKACEHIPNPFQYKKHDSIQPYLPSMPSLSDNYSLDSLKDGVVLIRFVIWLAMSDPKPMANAAMGPTQSMLSEPQSTTSTTSMVTINTLQSPTGSLNNAGTTTTATRTRRRLRPSNRNASEVPPSASMISNSDQFFGNMNNVNTMPVPQPVASVNPNTIPSKSLHESRHGVPIAAPLMALHSSIITIDHFQLLEAIASDPLEHQRELMSLLFVIMRQLKLSMFDSSHNDIILPDDIIKGNMPSIHTVISSLIEYSMRNKSLHHPSNFMNCIITNLGSETSKLNDLNKLATLAAAKPINVQYKAFSQIDTMSNNQCAISSEDLTSWEAFSNSDLSSGNSSFSPRGRGNALLSPKGSLIAAANKMVQPWSPKKLFTNETRHQMFSFDENLEEPGSPTARSHQNEDLASPQSIRDASEKKIVDGNRSVKATPRKSKRLNDKSAVVVSSTDLNNGTKVLTMKGQEGDLYNNLADAIDTYLENISTSIAVTNINNHIAVVERLTKIKLT